MKIVIMVTVLIFTVSAAYPSDTFIISTSCGGGIAANHNTHMINQDGVITRKVSSYVIPEQNKEEEIVGRINAGDAKQLYMRLMQIDFMNLNYSHPHNYSCSLSLAVDATVHTVTWPGDYTAKNGAGKAPAEIKQALDVFIKISTLLAPFVKK